MKKLRLLHAADLHLDSPFEGLEQDKAVLRRKEQRLLLDRIAALANDRQVDLVLLSGDLMDSDSAYMETSEGLVKALGSISAPVFIAPGNHDAYSARSPYAKLKWPENVHIFTHPHIECVPLPDKNVRVWGAGFTGSDCPGMLTGFEAEKEPELLDVMCIHGEVGAGASVYDPISQDDIARSGMDYIALGHIHKQSGLCRAGDSFYAWPGCPEGRGFDETGDRFVYIVELYQGKCDIQPVSVAARRYEILEVDVSDGGDVAAKLPANTQNDIYRLILTGETDEAPDLGAVRRAAEDRFFALQLRDMTRLRRDVWEKSGEDTLRGLFLKKLREVYDSAKTDDEREKVQQAARWGLAALDNREEVSSWK